MDSFQQIAAHCEVNSRITKPLIDEFLLYYAAERDGLEKKMDRKLKAYKHIARNIPSQTLNTLKSEYIAGQIFQQNGLIGKYLKHSMIKALSPENYQYLSAQYKTPWRYSFAVIIDQPAEDFFQMHDVFSGEEYLLYSPGTSRTQEERPGIQIWFNLIAFNGKCWQTYGVIIGFKGFTANDLFFFATELQPDIEDEHDLIREVEKNPWPFFMLLSRSEMPFTESQGQLLVYHSALDEIPAFPYDQLKDTFTLKWKDKVYKLQLQEWSEHPHFASAYYDEIEGTLFRFATTAAGFSHLTKLLLQKGIKLEIEPEVEVTPAMLVATEEILRREINLNPYDGLFVDQNKKESEEIEKLNHFLELVMPYINQDAAYNLEELAAEAGLEIEIAKDLLEKTRGLYRDIKGKKKG